MTFFGIILTLLAIFLILLVLVQRGRGGGLAGALGGIGGSSAFGAKAGDVFTKITIVTATIWIIVCMAAVYFSKAPDDALSGVGSRARDRAVVEGPADESATGTEDVPVAAPATTGDTGTNENAQGPGAAAPEE